MNRFSICQAYAQLEADYNVGGWLRERPSNQRRLESIGVQLSRIGFSNPYGWVDMEAEPSDEDDDDDGEVREVYLRAVLRLNLPISAALMRAMRRFFVPEFWHVTRKLRTKNTNVKADKMNIRKKDISVFLNHAGALVLSTVHNGYYVSRTYYDVPLKWARVEFINELKVKK